MDAAADRRLATSARQLTRYLARQLPPATSARQGKRRLTYRRRVVGDFVKLIRCLQQTGSERGGRWHPLNEADRQLVEELTTTTDTLTEEALAERLARGDTMQGYMHYLDVHVQRIGAPSPIVGTLCGKRVLIGDATTFVLNKPEHALCQDCRHEAARRARGEGRAAPMIITQQLADETPVCACRGYIEAGHTLVKIYGTCDDRPAWWVACPDCGQALGMVHSQDLEGEQGKA